MFNDELYSLCEKREAADISVLGLSTDLAVKDRQPPYGNRDGTVRFWIKQDSSIHLKALDLSSSDPVVGGWRRK